MSKPAVLLIGVDTPTGLSIMRELGRHNVPVHAVGRNSRSIGAASRYCTSFWSRPDGEISSWLPDLIKKTDAKAVIAWSENDLIALANLPELIGDCRVLTPRHNTLEQVLDKAKTLALAQSLHIDAPRHWTKNPEIWPVVVKWSDPMRIIPKLDAAGLDFEKAEFCNDQAALDKVLSRYDLIDEKPMVQSYAKGIGIGQMFYMKARKTTLFFQHQRLHEWPPEGGVSTLCQSIAPDQHQEQRAKSEALLKALNWEGPAMVEYRWDQQTGRYTLMEINGRFWGSQPLAMHAGAAFGWEHYRQNMLDDNSPAGDYKPGLQARYMIPETKRLLRLLFQKKQIADPVFKPQPLRDLWSYLSGFFNPAMRYYIFTFDDPKPYFADCVNIFRKILRLEK